MPTCTRTRKDGTVVHTTKAAAYRRRKEQAKAAEVQRRNEAQRRPRARAALKPVRELIPPTEHGAVRITRWGKTHRVDEDGRTTYCGLTATRQRFPVREAGAFCVDCSKEIERRAYQLIRDYQEESAA